MSDRSAFKVGPIGPESWTDGGDRKHDPEIEQGPKIDAPWILEATPIFVVSKIHGASIYGPCSFSGSWIVFPVPPSVQLSGPIGPTDITCVPRVRDAGLPEHPGDVILGTQEVRTRDSYNKILV